VLCYDAGDACDVCGVWCGVWCGVVWCGVGWGVICGVVWCGVVCGCGGGLFLSPHYSFTHPLSSHSAISFSYNTFRSCGFG
jgi:hypothetical protein